LSTAASDPAVAAGPADDPAPPPSTSLARRGAAAVGFVALAAAIVLLRQPGVPSWNTVWAEDGEKFAAQALTLSALHSLTSPYAGYLQLLPRLLALPVRVLPVAWYARWFALAGAVTAGLLGLLVVHSAEGWITNRGLRWLLGLVLVTTPTIAYELNANVVNLNWVLLAAAFWVVASRRRGAAETALRASVLVLTALSTPLAALLVPFCIVVTARRRRRADLVVLGALLGGLALQAAVSYSTPRVPKSGAHYGQATEGFFVRVLGSLVLGEHWVRDLFPAHTHTVILGPLVVLGVIAVLARADRLRGDRAWFVAGALFTAVASYALVAMVRGTDWMPYANPDGTYSTAGSRYMFGPIFLVLSAIFVLVDQARADWLKALVAAWVLVVTVSSWHVPIPRSTGPAWSTGVRQAQTACRAHPTQADVSIPVSPYPWQASIPCARLR
jgi:hypothetical protein